MLRFDFFELQRKTKNIFSSVWTPGPDPTATKPPWLKMAFRTPKTPLKPLSRVPGPLSAPNRAHWVRIRCAIRFVQQFAAPKTASKTGIIHLACLARFGPVLDPNGLETAFQCAHPLRGYQDLGTGKKQQITNCGCMRPNRRECPEDECCAGKMRFQRAPTGPATPRRPVTAGTARKGARQWSPPIEVTTFSGLTGKWQTANGTKHDGRKRKV